MNDVYQPLREDGIVLNDDEHVRELATMLLLADEHPHLQSRLLDGVQVNVIGEVQLEVIEAFMRMRGEPETGRSAVRCSCRGRGWDSGAGNGSPATVQAYAFGLRRERPSRRRSESFPYKSITLAPHLLDLWSTDQTTVTSAAGRQWPARR